MAGSVVAIDLEIGATVNYNCNTQSKINIDNSIYSTITVDEKVNTIIEFGVNI